MPTVTDNLSLLTMNQFGKTTSKGQFLDFLKETLTIFEKQNVIVKGIRADRGFFDEKRLVFLEGFGA